MNSTVIVVDKKQGYIFRYGLDGTFLNRIGNQGFGPEEFHQITNVTIDEKYVYVGNVSARKIYCYAHNGDFVKCIQSTFDLMYDDIVVLPNGNFLCHDIVGYKGDGKLWIMDTDGNMRQELLLHKAIYPYSYGPFNTISYTENRNVYKILDPISGYLYYYNTVTDCLEVSHIFVSEMNGLEHFEGHYNLLSIKDDFAYPLFYSESETLCYMIWNTSESVALHSSFLKNDEMIQVYKRLEMDIAEYPCCSLPVSTNLSGAMVMVMTNEYSSDCFPKGYDKDILERSLVLNVFYLK